MWQLLKHIVLYAMYVYSIRGSAYELYSDMKSCCLHLVIVLLNKWYAISLLITIMYFLSSLNL